MSKIYINTSDAKSLRCIKSNRMIPLELLEGKNEKNLNENKIILGYKSRFFMTVKLSNLDIVQKGIRKGYNVTVLVDCKKNKDNNNSSISLEEIDNIIKKIKKSTIISTNEKSYSTRDIVTLSKNKNVVTLIQIISSSHNHSTVHKNCVTNCSKKIICKKNGRLVLRTVKLHYCSKCKQYFDFSNSFYNQLSNLKMSRNDVYAILINDKNKEIHHESTNLKLNEESRLKILGYSSKLSTRFRQKMLKDFAFHNLLSISEMKSILEFLIRFVGSQDRMSKSRDIWEDDIKFLNRLIDNF